jgi:hypothetical protein
MGFRNAFDGCGGEQRGPLGGRIAHRADTHSGALYNSGLVWLTNAATFALWYFEIDSGGPDKREKDGYLFLAVTTNLTFGPTDTAVLSRRAKILTMVQSLLSVLIIAVVVVRATAQ